MKILVIGAGGREHALVWKLAQSPDVERLFCAPGNAGTEELAENVPIAARELPELARFAKENRIDLTVVGPDDSLAAGIVDLFEAEGLRIFGPRKKAAQLEASKIFAKELMQAEKIPTAAARTFSSAADALEYCDSVELPVVVKADGLALGKGVIMADERTAAKEAVRSMMEEGNFGEAGRRAVIEECLRGSECSVHALVSGTEFRMLATARDHKRAFDGDLGPNTGGMGALSPADNWSAASEKEFRHAIMRPLLDGLTSRSTVFRGLLFPGLMVTRDGLRVLEFNCRFGDPETQAILPRMKSDLLPALLATVEGGLLNVAIEFDQRIAVTVIIASAGYPGKYESGKPISGLARAAKLPDVFVFHAGTKRRGGEIVSAGGRVLAVTALGDSIAQARERAYAAVAGIDFDGCRFRRDIALATASE
ncbi:MAG: phosphoribosylamine--glycine ligase [Chthoniobacterales bacterium]|nr:MAG: phosphoribosylamine--glycine ligase [Chthoniobacterales bacterium]